MKTMRERFDEKFLRKESYDVMACSKCNNVIRPRTSHHSEDGFSECCGKKLKRMQGVQLGGIYRDYENDEISNVAESIIDFIEQELKLKDQEHKAELESIKKEIDMNRNEACDCTGAKFECEHWGFNQALDYSISILDSHINKLSN